MKLLMFHALEFWYKTSRKNLPDTVEVDEENEFKNSSLIFIHTEEKDENNKNSVLRKALKNILWHMRKVATDKIILHSFAHLSSSKSSPEFAKEAIDWLEMKIKERNIPVFKTPFGYFLEIKLHVSGESLGRVFKEI
ncbi:MAG: threonyl-tRNA synthetase editing domain-containing protein [Candidatus Asgardarchaeia archaeon]